MLYREIMAVCSEIHTKHINTVCGQNVELLNVNLAVHIVTAVRYIEWPLCGAYSYHWALEGYQMPPPPRVWLPATVAALYSTSQIA